MRPSPTSNMLAAIPGTPPAPVTPDTSCYCEVEATNAYGASVPSSEASATPSTAPTTLSTGDHMAQTPTGKGWWTTQANGQVITCGTARSYGSMVSRTLNAPVVGMAADSATGGYWLVAADGGIFAFDVPFYGSQGSHPPASPAGLAVTPIGAGCIGRLGGQLVHLRVLTRRPH